MYCVYSFMFYLFLYVLYFIPNLNETESEMVPGSENMAHITVLLHAAHETLPAITHQEISTAKGCCFGRHSPRCATSAHRFLQCTA